MVSANSRATVLWSQLIFLPSMLLGGLMMPLSLLPPSVLAVSALLPPAQAMQAFMGLAYSQETILNPLSASACWRPPRSWPLAWRSICSIGTGSTSPARRASRAGAAGAAAGDHRVSSSAD